MRNRIVTLFLLALLVTMTAAFVIPAQAGGNDHQNAGWFHKIDGGGRCRERYFEHYPNEGQGWEPGRCPAPTPDPTDEVTPTPDPTEEVTPTPDPTEEVSPTPDPTEEVSPTPAPTDEPGNGNNGNGGGASSAPVLPPFIQISVWPDMYQMSAHVVGFAWQVNGTFIYSDLNGNNSEDPGERVVTGTEYRDRVNGFGEFVDDQVLSRLVTGYRLNEVEDLNAFLSGFTAFAVLDDGTFVEIYGWYGINDEFLPLGADGVSQYRPQ